MRPDKPLSSLIEMASARGRPSTDVKEKKDASSVRHRKMCLYDLYPDKLSNMWIKNYHLDFSPWNEQEKKAYRYTFLLLNQEMKSHFDKAVRVASQRRVKWTSIDDFEPNRDMELVEQFLGTRFPIIKANPMDRQPVAKARKGAFSAREQRKAWLRAKALSEDPNYRNYVADIPNSVLADLEKIFRVDPFGNVISVYAVGPRKRSEGQEMIGGAGTCLASHYVPAVRGGPTTEDNCFMLHSRVASQKSSGFKQLRRPEELRLGVSVVQFATMLKHGGYGMPVMDYLLGFNPKESLAFPDERGVIFHPENMPGSWEGGGREAIHRTLIKLGECFRETGYRNFYPTSASTNPHLRNHGRSQIVPGKSGEREVAAGGVNGRWWSPSKKDAQSPRRKRTSQPSLHESREDSVPPARSIRKKSVERQGSISESNQTSMDSYLEADFHRKAFHMQRAASKDLSPRAAKRVGSQSPTRNEESEDSARTNITAVEPYAKSEERRPATARESRRDTTPSISAETKGNLRMRPSTARPSISGRTPRNGPSPALAAKTSTETKHARPTATKGPSERRDTKGEGIKKIAAHLGSELVPQGFSKGKGAALVNLKGRVRTAVAPRSSKSRSPSLTSRDKAKSTSEPQNTSSVMFDDDSNRTSVISPIPMPTQYSTPEGEQGRTDESIPRQRTPVPSPKPSLRKAEEVLPMSLSPISHVNGHPHHTSLATEEQPPREYETFHTVANIVGGGQVSREEKFSPGPSELDPPPDSYSENAPVFDVPASMTPQKKGIRDSNAVRHESLPLEDNPEIESECPDRWMRRTWARSRSRSPLHLRPGMSGHAPNAKNNPGKQHTKSASHQRKQAGKDALDRVLGYASPQSNRRMDDSRVSTEPELTVRCIVNGPEGVEPDINHWGELDPNLADYRRRKEREGQVGVVRGNEVVRRPQSPIEVGSARARAKGSAQATYRHSSSSPGYGGEKSISSTMSPKSKVRRHESASAHEAEKREDAHSVNNSHTMSQQGSPRHVGDTSIAESAIAEEAVSGVQRSALEIQDAMTARKRALGQLRHAAKELDILIKCKPQKFPSSIQDQEAERAVATALKLHKIVDKVTLPDHLFETACAAADHYVSVASNSFVGGVIKESLQEKPKEFLLKQVNDTITGWSDTLTDLGVRLFRLKPVLWAGPEAVASVKSAEVKMEKARREVDQFTKEVKGQVAPRRDAPSTCDTVRDAKVAVEIAERLVTTIDKTKDHALHFPVSPTRVKSSGGSAWRL